MTQNFKKLTGIFNTESKALVNSMLEVASAIFGYIFHFYLSIYFNYFPLSGEG